METSPKSWKQVDIEFQSRWCGPWSGNTRHTKLFLIFHFMLMPDILAIIEEQMRADDETTATQLVNIVNAAQYDVSKSAIVQAWRILGWTFHSSRYCQMIRTQNKEKRMEQTINHYHLTDNCYMLTGNIHE